MSLSRLHQNLVELAHAWCASLDRAENHIVILDDIERPGVRLPPRIGDYRPDLVWLRVDGTFRFIGEAKTGNDVNNPHTRKQLHCYLEMLELQGSGTLVVAVPWGSEGLAKMVLASAQRGLGYEQCRWLVVSDAP